MSDQEQGNGEGSTPEYAASKRKSPPVVTNDGTVRDELSAPEKLRIGGFAAPILRAAAKDGRSRRKVNVVGKDGSVRESTLGEVQQGLIVAHGLEFEVAEKTPETTYACAACAKEFTSSSSQVKVCNECRSPRPCADCGKTVSGQATMSLSRINRRNGAPPVCNKCHCKRVNLARAISRATCAGCGETLAVAAVLPPSIASRRKSAPMCGSCRSQARAATKKQAPHCVVCDKSLNRKMNTPYHVALRGGRPPKCRGCKAAEVRSTRFPLPMCKCGQVGTKRDREPAVVKLRGGAPYACRACRERESRQ